jgi:hypothetical protein
MHLAVRRRRRSCREIQQVNNTALITRQQTTLINLIDLGVTILTFAHRSSAFMRRFHVGYDIASVSARGGARDCHWIVEVDSTIWQRRRQDLRYARQFLSESKTNPVFMHRRWLTRVDQLHIYTIWSLIMFRIRIYTAVRPLTYALKNIELICMYNLTHRLRCHARTFPRCCIRNHAGWRMLRAYRTAVVCFQLRRRIWNSAMIAGKWMNLISAFLVEHLSSIGTAAFSIALKWRYVHVTLISNSQS